MRETETNSEPLDREMTDRKEMGITEPSADEREKIDT